MRNLQNFVEVATCAAVLALFAVGCNSDTCPDDFTGVPGTDCKCGLSYKISHPCCQGEYVEGPSSSETCVLDDGTLVARSQVGGTSDPTPDAPAVNQSTPVLEVLDLQAAQWDENDVRISQVGIPTGEPYEVRWRYHNLMKTTLLASGDYDFYALANLQGPTLTTTRGVGVDAEKIDNRDASWDEIAAASIQDLSEDFEGQTAETYQLDLSPLPVTVNGGDVHTSYNVED